jgi:SAM-dependent methyltransferase
VKYQTAGADYSAPVTLDLDPTTNPDVLWDLNTLPYPFDSDSFDEIHAYEVLEHCGSQGDWRFFFAQFQELWRILKPGGRLIFTVPAPGSVWVWGDPGHTRAIPPEQMIFLSQAEYEKQVGKTAMTDYRHVYSADFEAQAIEIQGGTFLCVLGGKK